MASRGSEPRRRRAALWRGAVAVLTGFAAVTPGHAAPGRPAPDPPAALLLDAGLLARLRTLAGALHSEIVLCLTGVVSGDTVTATGFVMPDPYSSRPDGAAFGPCPPGAVAIWHNHPVEDPPGTVRGGDPSYRRPRGDSLASAREYCALSQTDIRTVARDGYRFAIVAVDHDTWCWWTREQVLALAQRGAPRGDPVFGQISPAAAGPPRPPHTP